MGKKPRSSPSAALENNGSKHQSVSNDSLRAFISWSGERSKVLAQAINDWLPLVLHYVEPWMSEASIEAGERWGVAVAKELEASNFGIICVTRENIASPWVLFEAGALAKSLEQSRVIPILLDLDFKDITGPLAQFQAKKMEKAGFAEVVQSINGIGGQKVLEPRANQLFEALWPQLEEKVAAIPASAPTTKPNRSNNEVIEELVASVRSLETRLREMDERPHLNAKHRNRVHPEMLEEMMHVSHGDPAGMLMFASVIRDDLPWLYEVAMETYRVMKSGDPLQIQREMKQLRHNYDFLFHGPVSHSINDKRIERIVMRFPRILEHALENALERANAEKPVSAPSSTRRRA